MLLIHPNMPCLEIHPPAPTADHLLAPTVIHPPALTHPPTAVIHLSTIIHPPTILRRIMALGHNAMPSMVWHQLVLVC
jgi:hypothetical protein